jgi:hypothetical protein
MATPGHLQWIIGGVTIAMGMAAAWVGAMVAARSLSCARRAYRRTSGLAAASVEAWGVWFLGGFSGVTMGLRWLYAVAVWLAWTAAGLGLLWLGIRLLDLV